MLRKLRDRFHKKPDLEIEEIAPGNLKLKAGDVEVSVALPQPEFPMPEPLPPITLVSPACPYCGVLQEPAPTRRRKCRDCGETIHIRTDQEERKKYLLTKEEADRLEREDWDKRRRELNQTVIEAARNNDWHTMKMAHFQQALMLFRRGGDHHQLAAESRKSELRYFRAVYQEMGGERVTVSTAGEQACAECRRLEGQELSIDEAMELMPIPIKACKTWADKNPNGGWCRCSYSPVTTR